MSSKEAVPIEEVDALTFEKDESKKPGRPIKDLEEGRRIHVSVAISPKNLSRITEKAEQLDTSRSDLVNKALSAYLDGIAIFKSEQEFKQALKEALEEALAEAKAEEGEEEEGKATRLRKWAEEKGKPKVEVEEENPKVEAEKKKDEGGFLSDLLGL